MRRLLLVVCATALLAACQTTPTVYAPASGPQSAGYSESPIENDRWRVTFRGQPGTDATRVYSLALQRAAELTLSKGYDWFRVTERSGGAVGGGGPVVSLGIGGASFGRHSAVGASGSTGFDLGGGPAYVATIEILMNKGPTPREPDAYDARQIRATAGQPS
ncbi:CC0125/CC1285 family lipoprotein [Phenylobacterium montanum]|uniref:Lipoprotein n=1 Tax=Phenylobacterium montanum TaxID=2823693 RepID=A0A975G0W6_9CAUL|nr:hypothetical protein [Caulobacter sp. S6]QUD88437.1 hypothetical protein KCG34_00640 [Caulobacter sp. S6]